MTTIDHLRYDEVCFKASHNSIDRKQTIVHQLSGTGGLVEPCRALELDLVQSAHRFEWTVKHGIRDEGPDLRAVLKEISAWSRAPENAQHPVVTIHFDLKNAPLSHRGFARAFDELLLETFGAGAIYSPVKVIGEHDDLVRAAKAGSWAKLGRLRGRFVFCLSGHARRKSEYARDQPRTRLCFADYAGSKRVPRKGHRVFANLFVDAAGYPGHLERYRKHQGFIPRGYSIVTRRLWDVSVAGGASVLSTDDLDNPELSLGGEGYASKSQTG